ncbi:hypothetical protein OPQ81_003667 [Rhizoctonia solani]|nr:hypothetical protein OPQ81_003667 [Rhizoctonia solani]
MSHSGRSSLSDLSVQTLPLTPAPPSHKRTPSRTYFSLADEEFPGPVDNSQPEAEPTHGFEKLGFGESVAIGLSQVVDGSNPCSSVLKFSISMIQANRT